MIGIRAVYWLICDSLFEVRGGICLGGRGQPTRPGKLSAFISVQTV